MIVGITGHQSLRNPEWVLQEIIKALCSQPQPITGVTSLAIGADQVFARAVLDIGGTLYVVLPFMGYGEVFDTKERREYERLLSCASSTEVVPEQGSREQAYFAAGKRVVEMSDLVVAVWNGERAAGLGGTGDIARYAKQRRKQFVQIDPDAMVTTHTE